MDDPILRKILSEEELDFYVKQTELSKKTGKEVIFIETDTYLNSATSFSQYIYSNVRLITMIGELHNIKFTCGSSSMSVAEYCMTALQRNPKCVVMLEFGLQTDPRSINSANIVETYTMLSKSNYTQQIVPFDMRPFFLTQAIQNDLYGDRYNLYDQKGVFDAFITPFYTKWRENPTIFSLSGNYTQEAGRYLTEVYFTDMKNTFDLIAAEINGGVPLKDIHLKLNHAWKKVSDYFVLTLLLRVDDIDEYIILLGEEHRFNLEKILTSFPDMLTLNTQSNKKQSDCVSLYSSYLL